jgi:hypothetical protein
MKLRKSPANWERHQLKLMNFGMIVFKVHGQSLTKPKIQSKF